ncbi:MAG: hypothetical protein NZZ41_01045, partial [Candidatus Dojkabacteria bacterium]|nr:hypothetical protein [Candidatus Dojkabacteria bacterium]
MSFKKNTNIKFSENYVVKVVGNSAENYYSNPSLGVTFKNVKIFDKGKYNNLLNKLNNISDNNTKTICGFNTYASGKIAHIYLGKTQDPDPEFAKHVVIKNVDDTNQQTQIFSPLVFFNWLQEKCAKYFLFANLICYRKDHGILNIIKNEDYLVPFSQNIDPPKFYYEFNKQTVFIEQNSLKNDKIIVSGFDLLFLNTEKVDGVPVVSDKIFEIDTWYNGNFSKKTLAQNIGIGYLNDKKSSGDNRYNLGDRYNWEFGSIYFTLNISSEINKDILGNTKICTKNNEVQSGEIHDTKNNRIPESVRKGKEIKADYSKPDEIKLRAWVFYIDNILAEKDVYNRNNKISWENTQILFGINKNDVHIPQNISYITASPFLGDFWNPSTTNLSSEIETISNTNWVEYTIDDDGNISASLFNSGFLTYLPEANATYYNFYGKKDHELFRDIGIYLNTTYNWHYKPFGKATIKNYLKKIVPDNCFNITLRPKSQNLVFSDNGCYYCYFRKYTYCNQLKVKNIYFVSKYKKHYVNWEDRDFCDQQNGSHSDYDYDDHSTMIIGPLRIEEIEVNNQDKLYKLFAEKDSLFIVYTAKGKSYDCHALDVRTFNFFTSAIEESISFPVSSFGSFTPPYSQCITNKITISSSSPLTIFAKKSQNIRLYLNNLSEVKCVYGTSCSSFHDVLHPVSKKPASVVLSSPPVGFYNSGEDIYKPVEYNILSTNLSLLNSFLFTENVKKYVEENLQFTLEIKSKFLENVENITIYFPNNIYNNNNISNTTAYFSFESQEQDEKGNWILTYNVYQKIQESQKEGIQLHYISYVQNKKSLDNHIVVTPVEEYDAIHNMRIEPNINDFDLTCIEGELILEDNSFSVNNLENLVRNNISLAIKTQDSSGNKQIYSLSNDSKFYFANKSSITGFDSENSIKLQFGLMDKVFNSENEYDGFFEIIVKKCVPNNEKNYLFIGEVKIIVENTCEGIEYTPPEEDIIFPPPPPPPPPPP